VGLHRAWRRPVRSVVAGGALAVVLLAGCSSAPGPAVVVSDTGSGQFDLVRLS